MANSNTFRENMALAGTGQATHINVHTADPGSTGTSESTGARGPIVWTGGAVDGTVNGAELTLASVPVGTYTYAGLFNGATGSGYLTSYLLPAPVTLTSIGPIKVTPQFVYPA